MAWGIAESSSVMLRNFEYGLEKNVNEQKLELNLVTWNKFQESQDDSLFLKGV